MLKAGSIRSTNNENLQIFFLIHRTSPKIEVNIAAPKVMTQHKGHERGESTKTILPLIGSEIAR
jgi:hypothetical protein